MIKPQRCSAGAPAPCLGCADRPRLPPPQPPARGSPLPGARSALARCPGIGRWRLHETGFLYTRSTDRCWDAVLFRYRGVLPTFSVITDPSPSNLSKADGTRFRSTSCLGYRRWYTCWCTHTALAAWTLRAWIADTGDESPMKDRKHQYGCLTRVAGHGTLQYRIQDNGNQATTSRRRRHANPPETRSRRMRKGGNR